MRVDPPARAMDGVSGRDVELIMNNVSGGREEVSPLFDVLALMRASVAATCLGSISGGAVAVAACVSGVRTAGLRASFDPRCREQFDVTGTATDIASRAERVEATAEIYVERLSVATGQPTAVVALAIAEGQPMTAGQALDWGLIDSINGRNDRAS